MCRHDKARPDEPEKKWDDEEEPVPRTKIYTYIKLRIIPRVQIPRSSKTHIKVDGTTYVIYKIYLRFPPQSQKSPHVKLILTLPPLLVILVETSAFLSPSSLELCTLPSSLTTNVGHPCSPLSNRGDPLGESCVAAFLLLLPSIISGMGGVCVRVDVDLLRVRDSEQPMEFERNLTHQEGGRSEKGELSLLREG